MDRLKGARHPAARVALLALGGTLLLLAPLVGALPGPGGVFVLAAGLALLLRNSIGARRWFARAMRRCPRVGALADRAMRRPSARRRRENAGRSLPDERHVNRQPVSMGDPPAIGELASEPRNPPA